MKYIIYILKINIYNLKSDSQSMFTPILHLIINLLKFLEFLFEDYIIVISCTTYLKECCGDTDFCFQMLTCLDLILLYSSDTFSNNFYV